MGTITTAQRLHAPTHVARANSVLKKQLTVIQTYWSGQDSVKWTHVIIMYITMQFPILYIENIANVQKVNILKAGC